MYYWHPKEGAWQNAPLNTPLTMINRGVVFVCWLINFGNNGSRATSVLYSNGRSSSSPLETSPSVISSCLLTTQFDDAIGQRLSSNECIQSNRGCSFCTNSDCFQFIHQRCAESMPSGGSGVSQSNFAESLNFIFA